jgi:hypothetical protein
MTVGKPFRDADDAGPKPFHWVKSADDKCAAIERFCTCNTAATGYAELTVQDANM